MKKLFAVVWLLSPLLLAGNSGCVGETSEDRFAVDELAVVDLTEEQASKLFEMAEVVEEMGEESITEFRVGDRVFTVSSRERLLTIPVQFSDVGKGDIKAKVRMKTTCTHPGCDTLQTGKTCSVGGCVAGEATCGAPTCPGGSGCVVNADSCTLKNTGIFGDMYKPIFLGN